MKSRLALQLNAFLLRGGLRLLTYFAVYLGVPDPGWISQTICRRAWKPLLGLKIHVFLVRTRDSESWTFLPWIRDGKIWIGDICPESTHRFIQLDLLCPWRREQEPDPIVRRADPDPYQNVTDPENWFIRILVQAFPIQILVIKLI